MLAPLFTASVEAAYHGSIGYASTDFRIKWGSSPIRPSPKGPLRTYAAGSSLHVRPLHMVPEQPIRCRSFLPQPLRPARRPPTPTTGVGSTPSEAGCGPRWLTGSWSSAVDAITFSASDHACRIHGTDGCPKMRRLGDVRSGPCWDRRPTIADCLLALPIRTIVLRPEPARTTAQSPTLRQFQHRRGRYAPIS